MGEYDQHAIERKWQDYWEKEEIYKFDQESLENVYSIDNPPRYASGGLHIGHAAHYTHIDFAARYRRMRGYNVFFPLCFDVNGIPIEERVERKHGITRMDIDRHDFIKLCEDFANANIGEMTRQFKILGESMDPSIYYQTNAEYYRRLTQISFIQLYHRGLVYKGQYPINWCPRCMTALADAEVEYKQRDSALNTIRFELDDGSPLFIATTRPELLCTCQLIAVSPDDESKQHLIGRRAKVPVFGQEVEIISDRKVDPDFGTGVVMICSIGDKDDMEWIQTHGLEFCIAIEGDGTMNEIAGKYEGMKIAEARKAIVEDMNKGGLVEEIEPTEQNVGSCWRCKHPTEYVHKPQWFLKLLDFKDDVMDAANEMDWHPEYMKIRLREWVDSLQWDWVISRQRYFATPIPVWECECGKAVPANEEDCYIDPTVDAPPVPDCPDCGGELIGCEDVFDTWMDSSISPLYNSFWQRDERMFEALYPNSMRPQAHDIIRTWAFYTILRGKLLTGEKPFEHVMMDGFILSEDGTPMHASLGNVIDPLQFLEEYGADPLRYYAGTCALGEDNAFRTKDVVRGTRLCRKLYNINSFIGNALDELLDGGDVPERPDELMAMDHWILSEFSKVVEEATESGEVYRFDNVLRKAEYLLWHQLADHYLELVKYRVRNGIGRESASFTLYTVGLGVTKLLAPFLPHVAEECYQSFYRDYDGMKSIHVSSWPVPESFDDSEAVKGEAVMQAVASVRRWKSANGMPLNTEVPTAGIVSSLDLSACADEIKGPSRIGELVFPTTDEIEQAPVGAKPKFDIIGPEFRGDAKEVIGAIHSTKPSEILEGKTIEAGSREVRLADYSEIVTKAVYHGKEVDAEDDELVTVILFRT